jgi:hypothetical protein
MSRRCIPHVLGVFVVLAVVLPAAAAEPKAEPLVERVRRGIDRGVRYLREVEDGKGHWEVDGMLAQMRKGGQSCLAMLALLNAGVKPDDPIIERGLQYLRTLPPRLTYVVGLQTMVYVAAGRTEDRPRIQANVNWLLSQMNTADNQFAGWGYGSGPGNGLTSDNSNTQYALLGLHEAHRAGAVIKPEYWRVIRDYYQRSQRYNPATRQGDGGWGYAPFGNRDSTLTMTTAGLCGLLISGAELRDRREVITNGQVLRCGNYAEDEHTAAALAYLGERFTIANNPHVYYNLYGIERAGRLTGLRFLGNHDWYREGCEFLVANQNADGYWLGRGGFEQFRIVSTSFALLFLSKGRTPILISKLTHGPLNDWNNDRYDARNLADYCSKALFADTPLAWQIFDAKRGLRGNTRDEVLDLTAELLQSPIAYFNGHQAPRFSGAEESLLKEYVDQGGFILAEACCGRQEFDQGFRDLMARLFPGTPLRPLPPDHPLWRAHADVPPDVFPLEGIDMGCKTVVVYSPHDLSCYWEANQHDKAFDQGRGQLAFRLGANVVAYATGMELPKPRLTVHEVVRDEQAGRVIPRGYLKVAQLRHDGDWQPAPRAMRNLMQHLQEQTRLLVALKTEPVHPSQAAVLDFKFLYMHGRNAFSYGADSPALANLRADLQTGGLLFADACCGKKAFDGAFREFVKQLFPDKKLEPIPVDDVLYSEELNGKGRAITSVRRRPELPGGGAEAAYREAAPALEGIKYEGRWVVVYSKYDIGCALEKHQSSDCLGHDHQSAVRLGTAVVLYALKR